MPKFRVVQTSFIGNRLVQPGEIVDYDGEVHENLQKLSAKQAAAAADDADTGGTGGDTGAGLV